MVLDSILLESALRALGESLAEQNEHFEIVAIGGGSLLLCQEIERKTRDFDLIAIVIKGELISADPLPEVLLQAAEKIGQDLELGKDWLNPGGAPLLRMGLASGFMDRTHTLYYKGLTINLADRLDEICFKLYACIEFGPRYKHFQDLISLKPRETEIEQAVKWSYAAFDTEMKKTLKFLNELQSGRSIDQV